MGKKIVFKTASMIRSKSEQPLPEEVTKKIDEWIKTEDNSSEDRSSKTKISSSPLSAQENKTIRLNINISTITHKEIKKLCAEKGLSITDFVTRLLQKEIGI